MNLLFVDELFYIIEGRADLTYDGRRVPVEAGDLVFMPAQVAHRVINDHDKTYIALWVILTRSSDLGDIEEERDQGHEVKPNSDWSKWPFMPIAT